MAVTRANVGIRALRKLGVLGENETPDTATANDIDQAYAEVYAMIENENLAPWASNADVPDQYVPAMVNLCALARSVEKNISNSRLEKLHIETGGPTGKSCWAQIRAMATTKYVSTDNAVYY